MKKIFALLLILASCSPIHLVIDDPAPIQTGSRAIGWQTQRAKMDFRDSTNFKKIAEFEDGLRIGNKKTGSDVVDLDSVTTDLTNIYFYKGANILTAVPGVGSAAWGFISGTLTDQIDLAAALGLKANANNAGFTGTTTGITAAMVGAMSTSHAANVITATDLAHYNSAYGWGNHGSAGYALASALSGYVQTSVTVNGHALTGPIAVTKADLSIGNIDNTSDANKPISDLTATALTGKQATLISGTNIKTVGGINLLGSGDIAVGGTGTVTSVAVTTANGVSASVANPTTAANMTFSLGAIAPTSVNNISLSGASTPTLAVTGTSSITGANTGDNATNTQYSGLVSNATHSGDATGSGALTIATGAVSLAKMANMATASLIYRKSGGAGAPEVNSLVTLKTDLGLSNTNSGDQTDITGNAGTATKLYATKTINGIAFDGSANITVPSNIAPGTVGNVMQSNGSVWTAGTPKVNVSDTAAAFGKYLRNKGLRMTWVDGEMAFLNSTNDTVNIYQSYVGRTSMEEAMGEAVAPATVGMTADTILVFHNQRVYFMANNMESYPNYYVSNDGNDSWDGLTPATAWLTVAKVNGTTFQPGARINFNKGNIWRETLIVPSSGSASNPITFGSYGTGVAPIIQPTEQVTSWTQVGATDVWYGTLTTAPSQVFISDTYVQPAHWPTTAGSLTPTFQYPSGNSADATHLTDVDLTGRTSGELVGVQVNIYTNDFTQKNVAVSAWDDGTDILTMATVTLTPSTAERYYLTAPSGAGLTYANRSWMVTENTWFYDDDANRLYVWKTGGGNPGTAEASTGTNAVYSNDKGYITLDGIHVRYANEEGIFLSNTNLNISGIIVQNCTSNYNNQDGIRIGKTNNANPATITNTSISNNTLDHNYARGIMNNEVTGNNITDNVITYTGGLYPQLPGGGHAGLTAGIVLATDDGTFLIDGNTVNYTTQDGIFYQDALDGTVSNNAISNCAIYHFDSGGIYSVQVGSNVVTSHNTVTNSGTGIYFDSVSEGGTVEYNIVNGGTYAMILNQTTNVTVRYNRFTGPFTQGFCVAVHSITGPMTGVAFYYNIFDGQTDDGIIFMAAGTTNENSLFDIQNNLFMNCAVAINEYNDRPNLIDDLNNNIFYNNTTHIIGISSTVVSSDYNLFYGTGNWYWNGSAQATFALWKSASSSDANSLNVNPLFVGGGNYSLQVGSPAINAGVNVGLTEDFIGNPLVGLPDLGVYERQ